MKKIILLICFITLLSLTTKVYSDNASQVMKFLLHVGTSATDTSQDVTLDSLQNKIIVGNSASTSIDFDPNNIVSGDTVSTAGSNDIFIAKYNVANVLQWVKFLGGTGSDIGSGVTTDSSNNIIVSGHFTSASVDFDEDNIVSGDTHSAVGTQDAFIAKYNSAGVIQWVKPLGSVSAQMQGIDVMADSSGNIVAVGSISGPNPVDFDVDNIVSGDTLSSAGQTDIFIAKYNPSGVLQWLKVLGGTSPEVANSVDIDASGNIYVAGDFNSASVDFDEDNVVSGDTHSTAGSNDIFVAKYNASGVLQWVKALGGTSADNGNGVAVDTSGNVYVSGGTISGATVAVDYDEDAVTPGDTQIGRIFFLKLNSSGAFQWVKTPGTSGFGREVDTDSMGNSYFTAELVGTADFDEDNVISGDTQVSAGSNDFALAKYNSMGVLQWVKTAGDTAFQGNTDLYVFANDDVWATGGFQGTVDFDKDNILANDTVTSAGANDIYLVHYADAGIGIGDSMRIVLRDSEIAGASSDVEIWFDTVDVEANSSIKINYENAFTGGVSITTSDITVTCDLDGVDPLSGTVMTNVTVVSSENGYLELNTGADSCSDYTVVDINGGGGNQLTNPVTSGNYSFSVSVDNGDDGDIEGQGATLAYVQNENDIQITANVPPILDLELYEINSNTLLNGTGANTCALGVLSINTVSTCSYDIGTGTNNLAGVSITISSDGPLDDGSGNTINACFGTNCNGLGSAGVSAGEEEYGIYISELGGGEYTAANSFGTQHQAVPTVDAVFATSSSTGSGTTTGSILQRLEVVHAASISTATNQGSYSHTVTFKAYTN